MSYRKECIERLIVIAQGILDGVKDPIEGCREIIALSFTIGPNDPIFNEMLAIEDQCEDFPKGEARSKYSEEYLKKLDNECDEFLQEMMPHIIENCRKLIQYFSAKER